MLKSNQQEVAPELEQSELSAITNSLESVVGRLSDIICRNQELVAKIGGPNPLDRPTTEEKRENPTNVVENLRLGILLLNEEANKLEATNGVLIMLVD